VWSRRLPGFRLANSPPLSQYSYNIPYPQILWAFGPVLRTDGLIWIVLRTCEKSRKEKNNSLINENERRIMMFIVLLHWFWDWRRSEIKNRPLFLRTRNHNQTLFISFPCPRSSSFIAFSRLFCFFFILFRRFLFNENRSILTDFLSFLATSYGQNLAKSWNSLRQKD